MNSAEKEQLLAALKREHAGHAAALASWQRQVSGVGSPDLNDMATAEEEQRHVGKMIDRELAALGRIARAIARVETNRFDGTCVDCGHSIDIRRLVIEPATRHCTDCKELQEVGRHRRIPAALMQRFA